jgi:hypothetical protein
MLPTLPILRMLPLLPILKMLPTLPILRMLSALNTPRILKALRILKVLPKLSWLLRLANLKDETFTGRLFLPLPAPKGIVFFIVTLLPVFSSQHMPYLSFASMRLIHSLSLLDNRFKS